MYDREDLLELLDHERVELFLGEPGDLQTPRVTLVVGVTRNWGSAVI